MDRMSLGEGRCPSPRGAPIPRLRRRRALLRLLHSPHLLFSREVKELLFMKCAPSCIATASCWLCMARGPPSLRDRSEFFSASGSSLRESRAAFAPCSEYASTMLTLSAFRRFCSTSCLPDVAAAFYAMWRSPNGRQRVKRIRFVISCCAYFTIQLSIFKLFILSNSFLLFVTRMPFLAKTVAAII